LKFKYNEHCGYQENFFSLSELNSIVSYMDAQNATEAYDILKDKTKVSTGTTKGIDINHTDAYPWFVEHVLSPLRDYTGRSDLQLIFGFLSDINKSHRIHRDVKIIPEKEHNPNGTQFASFLIPVSVNNLPDCSACSTLVFADKLLEKPAEHEVWHDSVASDNSQFFSKKWNQLVDHRNYVLLQDMQWQQGGIIWWNSLHPHCGIDTKSAGIDTKKMIVIHTYV